ncbi:29170_t:CDS:1, partial [Racocetra persica]
DWGKCFTNWDSYLIWYWASALPILGFVYKKVLTNPSIVNILKRPKVLNKFATIVPY